MKNSPRLFRSLTLTACFVSSPILWADEDKDIYTVTRENCGNMALEKCEKVLMWAKKDSKETQQQISEDQAAIHKMHEEALQVMSEDAKQNQ